MVKPPKMVDTGEARAEIWGTGLSMCELLHTEDCVDGLVFLMKHHSEAEHMNLGSGADIWIVDLAPMVMGVVGLPPTARV